VDGERRAKLSRTKSLDGTFDPENLQDYDGKTPAQMGQTQSSWEKGAGALIQPGTGG